MIVAVSVAGTAVGGRFGFGYSRKGVEGDSARDSGDIKFTSQSLHHLVITNFSMS